MKKLSATLRKKLLGRLDELADELTNLDQDDFAAATNFSGKQTPFDVWVDQVNNLIIEHFGRESALYKNFRWLADDVKTESVSPMNDDDDGNSRLSEFLDSIYNELR